MKLAAAAIALLFTFATHAAEPGGQLTTPMPISQIIRIQTQRPACLRLYAECVVNSECCSGHCGGFGRRACLPPDWR